MRDSAALHFRSRFDARWLALALALVVACEAEAETPRVRYAEPIAEVGGRTLDQSVVRALAESTELDEADARDLALERLRLARAWEESQSELDPGAARAIRRAAMARLWLDEHFEPDHEIEDVPDELVARALADPQQTRRAFHPQLWMTCQVVIVPRGKGAVPPEDERERKKWDARAYEILDPIERTVRARWAQLESDDDCSMFFRIANLFADRGKDEGYKVKAERFNPAADDPLDAVFMEHLTAQDEPGILEPFPTRFGVHLVMVPELVPAHLEDGSLPQAELDAARAKEAREGLHPGWQRSKYVEVVERLREKRVVRVADGGEG